MDELSYLATAWPDIWPEARPEAGQGNEQGMPLNVHAFTTLRKGGFSTGDYSEFNLADHVGDDRQRVEKNRQKLKHDLQLPAEPVWLEQVHSNRVINAAENTSIQQADASFSRAKGVVCAVLTADCLPVFFCNKAGSEVAVAHAGWRGLHAGIITKTVQSMQSPADDILVSLGPAIGADAFEVGEEVYQAFTDNNNENESAFSATSASHYLCDIYQLARNELQSLGINKMAGGDFCSYHDSERFYSYRRQNTTGRMASLIWLS